MSLAASKKALEEGRYGDAEELARAVLRRELDNTEALLVKAKAHENLGNWQRAAISYCQLGQLLQDGHHYELAADIYRKIGLQSDSLFSLREAASLYDLQGESTRATSVRNRISALDEF